MVPQVSILVALLMLVDRIPLPEPPVGRGRPRTYPDRLFVTALVIMIVRRLPKGHRVLAVLAEPTPAMRPLRALLTENGRYPTRRTRERRLKAIPDTLPAQIACWGRHLLARIDPWQEDGSAAAIESTPLRAPGGVWPRKHREAGEVPHTSIDTDAPWTRSGWHDWIYGWKLPLITPVAAVGAPFGSPLAAELTAANVADNVQALPLVHHLPPVEEGGPRFLLGDVHDNDPQIRALWKASGRLLVTTKCRRYPHQDPGVEVRRIFHQLRSRASENFNGQFKAIFDCLGQVPTRGLVAPRRYVLGAVFVYQLALLHCFETGGDLRVGLKPLVQAA